MVPYILAILFGRFTQRAAAIIVIDDFDVPSVVEEPAGFDETAGIGELEARRITNFAVARGIGASGRIDIATKTQGVATVTLTTLGQDPLNGNVSAGFHLIYGQFHSAPPFTLETVDLTEGGSNDAVIVDIKSITGETLPRVARVRLISLGTALHEVLIREIPQTSEPIQLVFPFDEFVPRRGIMGLPPLDFQQIGSIELAFGSNFLESEGQIEQWEVKVDRIWIGSSTGIPEPEAFFLLTSLVMASFVSRQAVFAKWCRSATQTSQLCMVTVLLSHGLVPSANGIIVLDDFDVPSVVEEVDTFDMSDNVVELQAR